MISSLSTQVGVGENDTQAVLQVLSSCQNDADMLRAVSGIHGPWALVYWQVHSAFISLLAWQVLCQLVSFQTVHCVYIVWGIECIGYSIELVAKYHHQYENCAH